MHLDTSPAASPTAHDSPFHHDVLAGLRHTPKYLPSKYFYDERGSQLFDAICDLEAYYPTRTEMGIMETFIDEMAARIGPRAVLAEFGSGSSLKTRILLDHLSSPAGYVPIDISHEHLLKSAMRLAARYPRLPIHPISADYTTDFALPHIDEAAHVVAYFPGSTIGNFEPDEAALFMTRIAQLVGPGGGLLIGVDLQKEHAVLERAYDDPEGVTAAFNLNLLARINRELEATFDLEAFAHRAFYHAVEGRIEMHLESLQTQCVTIGDALIAFEAGEMIRTEYSYKYTVPQFAALAAHAGFDVERVWTDERSWFSVQYLVARS
ncbi:MAG: L-histidine N(alpha)-methyltransferase [Bacteroidota bacterium]